MPALQQIFSALTALLLALQASIAGIPPSTQLAQAAQTATLALSPSSSSVSVNGTFTVNIILNTGGQGVYGVDINHIHFNPSLLQVVDADLGTSGIQITEGSLMAMTIINSVDNANGAVQFSQLANPGSTYNGSGTLASITFRAIATGSSNVTFDFILGNGTDTNVAGLGGDSLASVGSGSYTITPAPDTTSPSVPSGLTASAISSSQINLSWTASTDNVGVTGYRVERCSGSATCSNFSQIATPSGTSYSNTGLTASTIYRYRVRAVDAAGNLSSYSSTANGTTGAPPDTTAPVISGITTSNVNQTGATISWNTNESSDTQVEYGPTVSYGFQTTLNSSLVSAHSAVVTGLTAGVTYHYRVKSRDAAGNLAQSTDQVFTAAELAKQPKKFILQSLEGVSSIGSYPTATVYVLNPSNGAVLDTQTLTANAIGEYTVNFSTAMPTTVNLRAHFTGYLSRLISGVNTTVSSTSTVMPQFIAGDFNNDDIINSLDFSVMNGRWLSADALTDVNRDGAVNSLDFSFLSKNWLLIGE